MKAAAPSVSSILLSAEFGEMKGGRTPAVLELAAQLGAMRSSVWNEVSVITALTPASAQSRRQNTKAVQEEKVN